MSSYASVKALHETLPPFAPVIPTAALPYIALLTLTAFFALTFTFSTRVPAREVLLEHGLMASRLPKSSNPVPELGIGLIASLLAGGGVVALFCTVGVYV